VTRPILPGSTIGVLGNGQLGRMLALAARRLGFRVHTFGPGANTPAAQVSDVGIEASYDDLDELRRFAREVDVLTFEFENVPAQSAAVAEEEAVVRPGPLALAVAQDRGAEKSFLAERGLPVTPFARVSTAADLASGLTRVGRPAVLKTAALGYDGKGQVVVGEHDDPLHAWLSIGGHASILEAFIDLDREISVVGARGVDGETAFYEPFENLHHDHILDVSIAPSGVPRPIAQHAIEITRAVLEAFDYVGVLCVEFFVGRDGRLLINEMAPRAHNSGHLTIDAARTSQFEQQVRAVCGLPLGSPALLQPAAMANLLGDLWLNGEPDWAAALRLPDIKLHLYGKSTARPGRKMGHLTALAPTAETARERVVAARSALKASGR
jgi:5-(carboxyamino)imidazole ribonucleotide synthase